MNNWVASLYAMENIQSPATNDMSFVQNAILESIGNCFQMWSILKICKSVLHTGSFPGYMHCQSWLILTLLGRGEKLDQYLRSTFLTLGFFWPVRAEKKWPFTQNVDFSIEIVTLILEIGLHTGSFPGYMHCQSWLILTLLGIRINIYERPNKSGLFVMMLNFLYKLWL